MIKGYSTYKHFNNHSWLARGRGAKPWDHTRPTYPELPPQCVRHAPKTTNTLRKIKHSQNNTNQHIRYSLTQKNDSKHTLTAATSAAKVKLNVTTTLLTYLFGENRTLGTFSQQEIHEKTTRIHKSSHFSCKPTHAQSFYYSYMETTQETRNSKAYKCHSQQ